MNEKTMMEKIDRILESHSIAPDKRDTLRKDIYKCVSDAYSDGWSDGQDDIVKAQAVNSLSCEVNARRWNMNENTVVLGYDELEGLLPLENEDARWFLLMLKYFGLVVMVYNGEAAFSAWVCTKDGECVSPMNGKTMPCRYGLTVGGAVLNLMETVVLARNNMKSRFGGNSPSASWERGTFSLTDGWPTWSAPGRLPRN